MQLELDDPYVVVYKQIHVVVDDGGSRVELMERSGVICVPGSSFGSLGEGYVRMALVLPPEELKKAVESIRVSGILKK